jgi:polysaccharide export outer membrane protein
MFSAASQGAKPGLITTGERYAAAGAQEVDYLLGPGDKVRIVVYNEPSLTGEFMVSSTGTLSLPLIGDVNAAGKSANDVAADVQKALANGYMRSPQVSGEVTLYRPFFILGEVKTPGQFPYASGLTVFNAIATAQGFTPRAQHNVVYIRAAGETEEQAYKLTPDLRVRPGDTLRIGERYF